ncbi:MAG: acyltransferase family protein [Rubripirellula sp.]
MSATAPDQPKAETTASIARRHDLDALRAIAMLLGIGLHGALAYMVLPRGGWPVQDIHQSSSFAAFMAAVHGFRMPLFFLISGFFTAMLWRKRGLKALIQHRFKRIFLPLLLGMFTFVPAVWIVSIGAGFLGATSTTLSADRDIWSATQLADREAILGHLDRGADVNGIEPTLGATPLTVAGWTGDVDTMNLLIEKGADVNRINRDGNVALAGATLFGRFGAVRVLVENGADIHFVNNDGNTASMIAETSWGITNYVAGLVEVDVTQEEVDAGREDILELLRETSAAAPASTAAKASEEQSKQDPWAGIMSLLLMFPFYHHLWFLAFLCWLVLMFAVYAWALDRFPWKTASTRFVVSPLRYAWLIPLTLLPQATMGLAFPSFGPDTSVGILPLPNVLFYYAIFFFFGAMYFDSDDQQGRVGKYWKLTIPISLFVLFPIGYELTHGGIGFANQIDSDLKRPLSVLTQVLYAWLMTFGLIGLFRSLFSGESKTLRYISDSSYWLYLAHLPLVIVLQTAVRNWPLPAFVKFAIVCLATCLILILSYQWIVRYTPIGTLLNGPRTRPSKTDPQPDPVTVTAS